MALIQRRTFLQGLGVAGTLCWPSGPSWPATRRRQQRVTGIGVNLAGAEFGSNKHGFSNRAPGGAGRDYTYNSRRSVDYFSSWGIRLFRIPFRWERLQPTLSQPLQPEELNRLESVVKWASAAGCTVVLDLHNYGRYRFGQRGKVVERAIEGGGIPAGPQLEQQHLVDLWLRLSAVFGSDKAVAAYGLMNEPHDLGPGTWKRVSNAVVRALRNRGDGKMILVAGDEWSSAVRFKEINGEQPWIDDPLRNTAYEAHCYFDADQSGKYLLGYDEELQRDADLPRRAHDNVQPFMDWCARNDVPGFIGEFGVPGDDRRWLALLRRFVHKLRKSNMPGCYWAAGEWWGDYPLSIQPANDFRRPAPQLLAIVSRQPN